MNSEHKTPTKRQLNRFYTWIGLFFGAVSANLLATLLIRHVPDMQLQFYLYLDCLRVACGAALGILLVLAAWKAAAIIACEDHLLLALADNVRARWGRLEQQGKEENGNE